MRTTDEVQYILSLKDLFTVKIKEAAGETDKLNKSVERVQGSSTSLSSTLRNAFTGIGVGIFAKQVYDVGTGFENAQMGLKTLLKTEEAAAQEFAAVMEDAQATPFDFKSLLMANRALISAGENADAARKVVLDLGNAIAASGGGSDELQRMVVNLQQIKNIGKASALDIKQFAFANIPIYAMLEEATGKTKEQLKDMDISYEVLAQALAKAREQGGMFANGLKNAMDTVAGKASNLGDKFDVLKFSLFNMAKGMLNQVFDGIARGFEAVQRYVEKNKEGIKSLIGIMIDLARGARPVVAIMATMLTIVGQVAEAWRKTGVWGKAFVGAIGTFVLAYKGLQMAHNIYNASLAVTAALTGNWVGLAAAGAIALAGATWYLVDAQSAANKELAKKQKTQKSVLGQMAKDGTPKMDFSKTVEQNTNITTKAEAPKYTQIHVNIGDLKAADSIYINDAKKADYRQIADRVMEMISSALTDSQRMAISR